MITLTRMIEWNGVPISNNNKIVVGGTADLALKLLMLKDIWHGTARD